MSSSPVGEGVVDDTSRVSFQIKLGKTRYSTRLTAFCGRIGPESALARAVCHFYDTKITFGMTCGVAHTAPSRSILRPSRAFFLDENVFLSDERRGGGGRFEIVKC
ncbi:hypothetical protein EVAR_65864_1 [Eumeta japonica]|uniref:Uncharacterized protein n=1 Tax=Eumeta variegata TaxID=151549 RepID=A0A4C1ZG63_EUMVA|nr:hypothetical protein EVAR_65864_1 [Eumeta japonica]